MRKWALIILAAVVAAGTVFWFGMDKETRNLVANLPTDRNVLFWSTPQRDAAFRAMDRLPALAKTNSIAANGKTLAFEPGKPLTGVDFDAHMKAQRNAALVIVQDGRVRFEKYALGFDAKGRWTSFSVAKSLTSTLVGAAIADGYIKSIDDKVSTYISDLKGSVYDDVSIRQLLTMTSGVKWNEDYTDPKSDVALFNDHKPEPGIDTTVSYMRKLPREAPAGTKWVYKTGETNLIGVLVSAATKKKLSDYLSEKIWTPFGMEQKATWLLGNTDHEISGCCIQAATRDFARFGMFVMSGGAGVVPKDWFAQATAKQADIDVPGQGYGYQWWTNDDGTFAAQGIFGQGIFIDSKRKLVIASNGNWPTATDGKLEEARESFYRKVQSAIDAEAQTGR